MSYLTDRRRFLKATALTGVGVWTGTALAAPEQSKSPNERVRFACIGVGGKGSYDSGEVKRLGDVVAICDVDDGTLAKAAEKSFPAAARYNDFRKMLDEAGKNFDAVTVSIPDHMHAVATATALRMGKACYTQKPLTRTIHEARRLGEIAREMKVPTQMGNQGTSFPPLRKTAAAVRAGVVGKVKEVHVWTNRPHWPCGGPRPPEAQVPPTLHWDLWLGPAPERPYAPGYHPNTWRGWWDFGSGALGDMACHTVNMPYMALDLRDPTAVQAETSGHNRDSFPKWAIIKYDFPANANRPAIAMTWYDGGKKPDPALFGGQEIPKTGVLLVGDGGTLLARGDYCEFGYKLLSGGSDMKVEYESSPGHYKELTDAIRGGPAPKSNFPDYAGPLTETILLGNLAVWAAPEAGTQGKKIEWDAKNLKATNAPEVEHVVVPTYRGGYQV
ncbi:MAG TPA: Gfo/Idh/MocA family oxidoreductase [Pirellulales bacterium]|jgi:predicted dehydrogenase|nr:Gfo/Idh/MocA family oxidoreductase [Pirellulales bacterium]